MHDPRKLLQEAITARVSSTSKCHKTKVIREAAAAFGCSTTFLWMLIREEGPRTFPGATLARAIEAYFGVPATAWAEDKERVRLARASVRAGLAGGDEAAA